MFLYIHIFNIIFEYNIGINLQTNFVYLFKAYNSICLLLNYLLLQNHVVIVRHTTISSYSF